MGLLSTEDSLTGNEKFLTGLANLIAIFLRRVASVITKIVIN